MTNKRERATSALPVKTRKRERINDYMRRPSSTSKGMWVQNMSETMQEMMAREQAEALATLMKANRALERIFGIEEGEEDE
jgi:hypothetical protein